MVYRGKEGHDGVEEGGEVGGDPVGEGQTAHVRQVLHQVPNIKYPHFCDVIRSVVKRQDHSNIHRNPFRLNNC